MIIAPQRFPGKTPPSVNVEYHPDGRPILIGALGRPFSRKSTDVRITIVCPRCGKSNHHGWSILGRQDVPSHRYGHCDCWQRGYYIVPAASNETGATT